MQEIMNVTTKKTLMQLLSMDEDAELNLLWKSDFHEYYAKSFHGNCDGYSNLLTVVKSNNGYISGGFSALAMSSVAGYKEDKEAFIFSLVNELNIPVKIDVNQLADLNGYNYLKAVYHSATYGPVFGAGHDMRIYNNYVYTNLGYSYQNPLYLRGTTQAKNLLAGSSSASLASVEVYELNTDKFSLVLGPTEAGLLINHFPDIELELIYRGSRDGFTSSSFHSKCDGVAKTITVIKSEDGSVCGGYTEAEWSSVTGYVPDEHAVLFSLKNNFDEPVFMNTANPAKSIYCHSDRLVTFGDDDLYIPDKPHNNECSAKIGKFYFHPSYPLDSKKSYKVLGGTEKFNILDIEVFKVKESSTLTMADIASLRTLLPTALGGKKMKLEFRASRDGWSLTNLITKCMGLTSTLTVIKSKYGLIFGGFRKTEFVYSSINMVDNDAFIFSLRNLDNTPMKIVDTRIAGATKYVYHSYYNYYGFGLSGYDWRLYSTLKTGYSNFGYTFKHPTYTYGSSASYDFLAGEQYFDVSDVEVFSIL